MNIVNKCIYTAAKSLIIINPSMEYFESKSWSCLEDLSIYLQPDSKVHIFLSSEKFLDGVKLVVDNLLTQNIRSLTLHIPYVYRSLLKQTKSLFSSITGIRIERMSKGMSFWESETFYKVSYNHFFGDNSKSLYQNVMYFIYDYQLQDFVTEYRTYTWKAWEEYKED